MIRTALGASTLALALAVAATATTACGGTAYQTLTLTNKSPRPIEQLFVYPTGQPRGPSRGTLAVDATTTVKMKPGGVDVYAISQKLIIDEHTRETPEASVTVELKRPLTVIFHDESTHPAEVDAADVREATFRVTPAPPADADGHGASDGASPDAPPPGE